jgi:hypothetical protein
MAALAWGRGSGGCESGRSPRRRVLEVVSSGRLYLLQRPVTVTDTARGSVCSS